MKGSERSRALQKACFGKGFCKLHTGQHVGGTSCHARAGAALSDGRGCCRALCCIKTNNLALDQDAAWLSTADQGVKWYDAVAAGGSAALRSCAIAAARPIPGDERKGRCAMSRSYRKVRLRANLVYSVEEVMSRYRVCRNTVSNWVQSGLHPVDRKIPQLFRGATLIQFHAARRARSRQHLRSGEFKCLGCKAAVFPELEGLVLH